MIADEFTKLSFRDCRGRVRVFTAAGRDNEAVIGRSAIGRATRWSSEQKGERFSVGSVK